MPMNFPDFNSLKRAAEIHQFRQPKSCEPENDYRIALADYVSKIDFVESEEIRNKVGWDKWNEQQKMAMLKRRGLIPL